MHYDENHDRYSLTLPYSELRIGFTGQPDFAFYVDGNPRNVNSVDFIDSKYLFYPDENKIMILFKNESEERLAKIAENKEDVYAYTAKSNLVAVVSTAATACSRV